MRPDLRRGVSFRIGYGGAQERYGITPDLTTLGKLIGGGLPVGAFGGNSQVMRHFDPREADYIGHGGTFNANPLTMVAGRATLDELRPERYEELEELARTLKEKLERVFVAANVPATINQVGSLFNIHLVDGPVTDYAEAQSGDLVLMRELYLAMLNHRVAFTGRGMGCLSTPMSEAEIDEVAEAVQLGLTDLGRA